MKHAVVVVKTSQNSYDVLPFTELQADKVANTYLPHFSPYSHSALWTLLDF